MEEEKRGPGRPKYKAIRHVQLHDALTPLGLPPQLSLSTIGEKKMVSLEERPHGVYVEHHSGRAFLVPYANIASMEYDQE